jgi:hypothetical protein
MGMMRRTFLRGGVPSVNHAPKATRHLEQEPAATSSQEVERYHHCNNLNKIQAERVYPPLFVSSARACHPVPPAKFAVPEQALAGSSSHFYKKNLTFLKSKPTIRMHKLFQIKKRFNI